MLIARYLYKYYIYRCHRNGRVYYKMDFLSCGSGFYADSDDEAIAIFAQWCDVLPQHITRGGAM